MVLGLLGIDIGTSGCKALMIGADGAVLASRTASYGVSQPRPGWTEQDPELWIDGAAKAVAGVLRDRADVEIAAVGLSGQMHGLTPLDASHRVLRPALLWNDQRNGAECREIETLAGGAEALLAHTGNRMLIGYTGGKIIWMRNHEPDIFGRLRHVLNPKDYLRLVLTGEIATEVSDASGTGLFDVRRRCWASGLVAQLQIDPAILPPCSESPVVTGRICPSAAGRFGLPEGVPVAGGGGDSVIQTIGSGVIAPGELQTTIGTAGILASALDTAEPNPGGRLQVFCNVGPGKWHCMGVSMNAGGAMDWFRTVMTGLAAEPPALSFDEIVARAAGSPVGAKGLLFLPYLNGERCPHPDPEARGAFIGLTSRHGAADLARSVMEGVNHAFYDMFALMERIGIGRSVIKASGGGARSPLWRQMQADIFDCDVVTTEGAAEGAAFGAALVAGVGIGLWPDVTSAAAVCRPVTRQSPDPVAGETLRRAFEIYRTLHPALSTSFAALGDARFDP